MLTYSLEERGGEGGANLLFGRERVVLTYSLQERGGEGGANLLFVGGKGRTSLLFGGEGRMVER